MARTRDPFGVAFNGLRMGLREGRFGPGAPLLAGELAKTLKVSPTPIREALSRLAGEGLIDDRRGRGYLTHRLEMNDLEDLYDLHLALVSAILRRGAEFTPSANRVVSDTLSSVELASDAAQSRDAAEAFFYTLVGGCGNALITRAHRLTTDRLAPVRLVEPEVIGDLQSELADLAALSVRGGAPQLYNAILHYHKRRTKLVRSIFMRIHTPSLR